MEPHFDKPLEFWREIVDEIFRNGLPRKIPEREVM